MAAVAAAAAERKKPMSLPSGLLLLLFPSRCVTLVPWPLAPESLPQSVSKRCSASSRVGRSSRTKWMVNRLWPAGGPSVAPQHGAGSVCVRTRCSN
uniref:Putative secreted protein n=1 Tax=Anopheles triannulatus TaxID=58253 RepID=A0A2M4B424_9DIPT